MRVAGWNRSLSTQLVAAASRSAAPEEAFTVALEGTPVEPT